MVRRNFGGRCNSLGGGKLSERLDSLRDRTLHGRLKLSEEQNSLRGFTLWRSELCGRLESMEDRTLWEAEFLGNKNSLSDFTLWRAGHSGRLDSLRDMTLYGRVELSGEQNSLR